MFRRHLPWLLKLCGGIRSQLETNGLAVWSIHALRFPMSCLDITQEIVG